MEETAPDTAFEELLEYIRTARGFDFTGYKRASLMRRVRRRMQMVGIEDYAGYLDHLQVHETEFTELFNFILINVTSFFRDEPVWAFLAKEIVPRIADDLAGEEAIRVWCAGCATGEEAYSIAILLAERLGDVAFQDRVKIYATDVDEQAVAAARSGRFPPKALEALDPGRVERFFERAGDAFSFRPDLRRSLIFGRHDLVQDAPIGKIDLVSCRNTLMYLNADVQTEIVNRFRFSLGDRGFLLLGKSEMLVTRTPAFVPVDLTHRVFATRWTEEDRDRTARWLTGTAPDDGRRSPRLSGIAFEGAAAPQLLVGSDGRLVMANLAAREAFGVREDDVGRPLQDLEISYRPADLRSMIDEAIRVGGPVQLSAVELRSGDKPPLLFDVEITPLQDRGSSSGVSIAFADVSEAQKLQRNLEIASQELETAMEELQSTNEELETTNEELQSTNEELETTNEELQSTNEELETMNEELQSTNEQLRALNMELHDRTSDLSDLNTLMDSVLSSVSTAVVLLDQQMRVRMWNAKSEDLWGLREDEVRGRSFLNLDIGLPLEPVERLILRTRLGERPEPVTVDGRDRRGRQIRCRIGCSPLDEADAGGVLLMVEPEVQDPEEVSS